MSHFSASIPFRKKTLYGKVSSKNRRTEAEKGSVYQVSKELLVRGLSTRCRRSF